jgi:hypothetical protein
VGVNHTKYNCVWVFPIALLTMNTDNSLALWCLLTDTSLDRDHCQTALLAVPQTSSYTFDADPMATSADLDTLEQGVSFLLSVQFLAAKAMGRDIHVGVEVVSSATNCCGIFNAKEVRVRMDLVVRMCGLPPKGKGVAPIPPMPTTAWPLKESASLSKHLWYRRPPLGLSSPCRT